MIELGQALQGLTIVDLGRGMSASIATKLLADLGARVLRFEPSSGDPFYDLYPAYPVWHRNAQLCRVSGTDDPAVVRALALADACVLGGEDFPGYECTFDAEAIAAQYPSLSILVLEGYPSDGACAGRPAVDLLVQARSGMAAEMAGSAPGDPPTYQAFGPGHYTAAVQGLTALLAALCQQARDDGAGQVVRTSLYEGLLTMMAPYWMRAAQPVGTFNFMVPRQARPLILSCRDGRCIHVALGSAGAKGQLYRVLGIDDPSVDIHASGAPTGREDPRNFYGDLDLLAEHVKRFDSVELTALLQACGVPVSRVLAPGECWDDPQVQHIGIVKTEPDGVRHVGLPMRGRVAAADPARRLAPAVAAGALPLAGLRVLDYGLWVAGPYGSVCLADLGAEVIKVDTLQGDPHIHMFRSFAVNNRGKRNIAIDLKTPEGREINDRLLAGAQVVKNNYRPGVSARLGLDPQTLLARDADKVVLESTGFGRSGPDCERPGFDMIFQAMCGHEVRNGGQGNPPLYSRSMVVDYSLGMLNGLAILVALWRRFCGAGGADLELCLTDAGVFTLSELIQRADGGFEGADPQNATRTGIHPAEACYRCADGWIAIAARGEPMAAALAHALGVSAGRRADWANAQAEAISAALAPRTAADALRMLSDAGVWAEACATSGEAVLFDEHASPGLVTRGQHPKFGEVLQAGSLFRLGSGRHSAPGAAPEFGAHTSHILIELGYSQEEIADFFARKIVAGR